jgi:hypothetical protein
LTVAAEPLDDDEDFSADGFSVDDFAVVPDAAPSALERPSLEPPSPPVAAGAVSDAEAALRAAEPRSFFAQPEPLKWIDGAEKAFRTGDAPQIGQASGPLAATPCITSKRWPFGQM